MATCSNCGGRGKIKCPGCGGIGTKLGGDWEDYTCDKCDGLKNEYKDYYGKIIYHNERGAVQLGSGTINCPQCNGTGQVGGLSSSSSSSYSSSSSKSSYSGERGVFLSIIFGLVFSFGAFFSAIWVSNLLTGDWSVFIAFAVLAAGFIITFIAWRNNKNFLFVLMLIIGLFGYLNLFGIIPDYSIVKQAEQIQEEIATATIVSGCNFRSGPSTNDDVIRQLTKGETVTLTGETSGNWTQISHNGDVGWVSAEFLGE